VPAGYEPLHGSDSTLLKISGVGMSPYAARGLSQTLSPIEQAKNVRRTINGESIDLSAEQFRKYASVITGNDQMPPGVDGIWPGHIVEVECISELQYVTIGGSASRPKVASSERTEDIYTYYRPILDMRVLDFDISTDEWGAQVGWTLTLEEI
jgi:hypothetical protein